MIPSSEIILKKDEEEEDRKETIRNIKNNLKNKKSTVIDKSKKNELLYILFSRKVTLILGNLSIYNRNSRNA